MQNGTPSDDQSKYQCCFCHHFNLEGYRWGYCTLLNVHIKGTVDACKLSVPPFSTQKSNENQ